MRTTFPALTAALLLLAASPALAAPTCWNDSGQTVRCGTPGALPVGQALSPEQEMARLASQAPGLSLAELIGGGLLIGGIFALIALMPQFEGWDGEKDD